MFVPNIKLDESLRQGLSYTLHIREFSLYGSHNVLVVATGGHIFQGVAHAHVELLHEIRWFLGYSTVEEVIFAVHRNQEFYVLPELLVQARLARSVVEVNRCDGSSRRCSQEVTCVLECHVPVRCFLLGLGPFDDAG